MTWIMPFFRLSGYLLCAFIAFLGVAKNLLRKPAPLPWPVTVANCPLFTEWTIFPIFFISRYRLPVRRFLRIIQSQHPMPVSYTHLLQLYYKLSNDSAFRNQPDRFFYCRHARHKRKPYESLARRPKAFARHADHARFFHQFQHKIE